MTVLCLEALCIAALRQATARGHSLTGAAAGLATTVESVSTIQRRLSLGSGETDDGGLVAGLWTIPYKLFPTTVY
ncbi:hypothetical protein ColKHC_11713 [Colletotrichum higginsianum]|nr:hypothetical protein ColKHC_11713 [Colletotrichum higginsianum]